jgi:type II secretory pathway component PulJ
MAKYIALVLAAIVGYLFYQSFPDIQRYMRIRSM